MTTKFEYAIEFVLGWEVGRDKRGKIKEDGGYNLDDGSPTKWGIREAANPGIDIANLSRAGAEEIYRSKYWNAYNLDQYELGLACAMFDSGVNCGPSRMLKWYDKVKDAADPAYRLIEIRDVYYRDLAKKTRLAADDPAKPVEYPYKKFLKGWLRRTADLKKYIDIIRHENNETSSERI